VITNDETEARDLLEALPAVSEAQLLALRDRLAGVADARGVLDVAYRTLDTPVGTLLLAATERGLVRVAYQVQGHEQALESLSARVSPRILHAPARLAAASREIDEYFAGQRRTFDLPLDFTLAHGFQAAVLSYLPDIAYGHTASYAAVAAMAGSPRAFRAVGTACAANPLPVVVPCHRVIRSDGSLSGYAGGPAAKQALLILENAA
jgi:methylated-DNA-[protein]-cysteine S-methyltransferase